jgi:hypothetical protein
MGVVLFTKKQSDTSLKYGIIDCKNIKRKFIMLLRYHKNIYFEHIKELVKVNNYINKLPYKFTAHFKKRLKRGNINNILYFIKDIILNYNNIIEYYYNTDTKQICKIVYRMQYNNYNDIILVLSNSKAIITIYFNNIYDKHDTLKKDLYINKAVYS